MLKIILATLAFTHGVTYAESCFTTDLDDDVVIEKLCLADEADSKRILSVQEAAKNRVCYPDVIFSYGTIYSSLNKSGNDKAEITLESVAGKRNTTSFCL